MDGGTWQATVHGVAKSQTRLSDFTFTFFGPGEVPALLDFSNCWLVHFFFLKKILCLLFIFNSVYLCVYLATLGLSWNMWYDPDQGEKPTPSSPTPCPGTASVESQPLDHQGSPGFTFQKQLCIGSEWVENILLP